MKKAKILFTIAVITATLFFGSCSNYDTITIVQEISQTIQNDKADSIYAKTIIVLNANGRSSAPSDTQFYDYSLASGEHKTFEFKDNQTGMRNTIEPLTKITLKYYIEIIDTKGNREAFMRTIATKESFSDTKLSETIVLKD